MLNFRAFLLTSLLFTVVNVIKTDTENGRNMFLYPGEAQSERDLTMCNKREVCSILHRRFWFPMQIERFCRCETNECPSTWSSSLDNFTMTLNNRAQMKFCEPITDLPLCMGNETKYLRVENRTTIPTFDMDTEEHYRISSNAECYCPEHRRWVDSKRWGNDTVNTHAYRCSELAKCNTDDLCGFERADYYAVYYQCSCPANHLCVRRNYTTYDVSQMFYTGEAFKAVCTKLIHMKTYNTSDSNN